MSHEYNSGLAVIVGSSCVCDGFDHCLKVLIAGQQRRTKRNFLKAVLVSFQFILQIGVLMAVHQVGRLYDQVLDPVCSCAIQGFLYIVDLQSVTLFQLVDDDLAGKCTAYLVLGESIRNGILNGADGDVAAVVVACTKAHDHNGSICGLLRVCGLSRRSVCLLCLLFICSLLSAGIRRLCCLGVVVSAAGKADCRYRQHSYDC